MSRSLTGNVPAREHDFHAILKEKNCDGGKLLVSTYREHRMVFLMRDDKLWAAMSLANAESKVGGIYLGRIRNVADAVNACFVELAPGELVFLPFSEMEGAFIRNRQSGEKPKAGDELILMVTRDAQKGKKASATAKLSKMKEVYQRFYSDEEAFLQAALHRTCYTRLVAPQDRFLTVINGLADLGEYAEIVTDLSDVYEKLLSACEAGEIDKTIRLYEDSALSLPILYSLERHMAEALEKKVWLKSGGTLVIEPTEALTVIDVNTGKKESKKDGEDTYLQVNEEAAREIARQLRLRNLSGIVVVDFINLRDPSSRKQLIDTLRTSIAECDSLNPARVIDMTALGLVEITRKKVHPPLAEQLK